jgi:hypothetical protein
MDENFLKTINAVYMLAEYFPETDPLTIKTKDKVLEISESYVSGRHTQKDIDVLLNYLALARGLGWINTMNYLIISKGLKAIKKIDARRPSTLVKAETRPKVESKALPDIASSEKQKSNLTARQQKIIEFLKQKEKAQVADLQQVLPDVTKRTIRRDLDELLVSGMIVRMGEFNQVFYQIG